MNLSKLLFSLMFLSVSAFAEVVPATVVSVKEIVNEIDTRVSQDCRPAYYEHRDRDYSGQIFGGIAGAALGSTIGKGDGRTAATLLGGVLGTNIGRDDRRRDEYRMECRPIYEPRYTIVGYEVRYVYMGQIRTTIMQTRPNGPYIFLDIEPKVMP